MSHTFNTGSILAIRRQRNKSETSASSTRNRLSVARTRTISLKSKKTSSSTQNDFTRGSSKEGVSKTVEKVVIEKNESSNEQEHIYDGDDAMSALDLVADALLIDMDRTGGNGVEYTDNVTAKERFEAGVKTAAALARKVEEDAEFLKREEEAIAAAIKKAESEAAAAINEECASKSVKNVDPDDALLYIEQVQAAYADRPQTFDEFLTILNLYESRQIDEAGVTEKICTLFNGNTKLVHGFRKFLPDEKPATFPTFDVKCGEIPDMIFCSEDDAESCITGQTISNFSGALLVTGKNREAPPVTKRRMSVEEAVLAQRRSKAKQQTHIIRGGIVWRMR